MNRALIIGIFSAAVCLGMEDWCSAQESAVLKRTEELKWLSYSDKVFDKKRYSAPTVLAIMKDLCPGCKAKRDALWSDDDVKKAVSKRKMVLFEGNAAKQEGLEDAIKKKFGVKSLPVVIILSKQMADKPLIIPGIPEPEDVVKALDKKLPIKKMQ